MNTTNSTPSNAASADAAALLAAHRTATPHIGLTCRYDGRLLMVNAVILREVGGPHVRLSGMPGAIAWSLTYPEAISYLTPPSSSCC